MRQRALSAALVLTTTVGLTLTVDTAAQAAAVQTTVGGVTFSADDAAPADGATVVEVGPDAPLDLTLPSSVVIAGTTYAVRAVGEGAADDVGLTSLTVPTSVNTIGDSAFAGNQLTSLALPDSVTAIGTNGFARNQLTTLDLPDGLTLLDEAVFAGNALTTVQLPDSLTRIASAAFAFNGLTTVTVPASVTGIADGAFTFNTGLASVVFAGPPPTEFTATGGDGVGSLGDESDPTVYFPARFGAPGFAGGYTTPTWMGYDAQAGLDLVPAALPQARVGAAYDQTITATGGTAPYRFSAKAGSLPAGLTLSPAGRLSGTPSRPGSFPVTVTATDTLTDAGARTYALVVAAAPGPPPVVNQRPRLEIAKVRRSRQGNGVFLFAITALNRGPGQAVQPKVRFANQPNGVSYPRRAALTGTLQPGERATVRLKVRATNRAVKLRVQVRAPNAKKDFRLVRLPRR